MCIVLDITPFVNVNDRQVVGGGCLMNEICWGTWEMEECLITAPSQSVALTHPRRPNAELRMRRRRNCAPDEDRDTSDRLRL